MSGTQLASYTYDSWGNIVKEDIKDDKLKEQPFRYASYFFDNESEQYYLMARYYNPKNGVFLSNNPMIDIDTEIDINNSYNYVGNSPIISYDFDGNYRRFARAIYKAAQKKQAKNSVKKHSRKKPSNKKKSKRKKKKYHGNSKKNMSKHHVYIIKNIRTKKIVKVGIHGGKIRRNGNSPRATLQANKWGRSRYRAEIVQRNIKGRNRALIAEQAWVNYYYRNFQLGLSEGKHKRPWPN